MKRALLVLLMLPVLAGCGQGVGQVVVTDTAGVSANPPVSATTPEDLASPTDQPVSTRQPEPQATPTDVLEPTVTAMAANDICSVPLLEQPRVVSLALPSEREVGDQFALANGETLFGMAHIEDENTLMLQLDGAEPLRATLSAYSLWSDMALLEWPDGKQQVFLVLDWGNTAWWRMLYIFDPASGTALSVELYFAKDEERELTGDVQYTVADVLDEPQFSRERAYLQNIMCEYGDGTTWASGEPHTPEQRGGMNFRPGQTFVPVTDDVVLRIPFREGGRRVGFVEFHARDGGDPACGFPGLGRRGDILILREGQEPVAIEYAWDGACISQDMRRVLPNGWDEDIAYDLSGDAAPRLCLLNPREAIILCLTIDDQAQRFSFLPGDRATPDVIQRLDPERRYFEMIFGP
jgi:hypothetical protein